MTPPLVLGFDTAAAHCAVAIVRGDRVLASAEEQMAKGQGERLLVLCEALLALTGQAWRDLEAIGVGTGPGNFTGIRIAVAAARGLALGLKIPAVGVSGFDALRLGTEGPVACAIDARRAGRYVQVFGQEQVAEPGLFADGCLPDFEGPLIGAGGRAPVHPVAEAVALRAAARCHSPQPRPAPLYLRPADAAPARHAAPPLLA